MAILEINKQKELIRDTLKGLLHQYKNNEIDDATFANNVAGLFRFDAAIEGDPFLHTFVGNAGILELPENQVERRGIDRKAGMKKLVEDIEKYLS